MPHSNMIQPHFSSEAAVRVGSLGAAWPSVSSTRENSSRSSRPNRTLDFSNGMAVMANVPTSAEDKAGSEGAVAAGGRAGPWNRPVESSPRSWLWIRWTFSLAAISLPFSMPALERSDPDDCGCILVADAYFSNMTDGRPCSVAFGVSSTIPLTGTEATGSTAASLSIHSLNKTLSSANAKPPNTLRLTEANAKPLGT